MEEKSVIAIHGCGFKNKNEICQVGKLRLETLSQFKKEEVTNLIISGGVPYEKNSELLAKLMGQWIKKSGIQWRNIDYATNCFNSSTAVQNILSIAQQQKFDRLIVISSYWHLWALKPIYKYWGRELNFHSTIHPYHSHKNMDRYLTSKQTRVFYFFYACLIRLAIWLHLFEPLDKFLSSTFSKRKNGYPVSGCS